ncbi:MAG: prepilin-type N-terminal cleavage/methylation domain-containing protein [Candidatus Beckwithbacteria bacterium]
MKKLKAKSGFTFIEMLVTVTIIAVLTTIGTTSFRVANQKARDGRRQGDLQQVRAALELYRTDQDVYPTTAQFPDAGESLAAGGVTYLGEMPGDPLEGNSYVYSSDGSTYILAAYLELAKSDDSAVAGCSEAGCNYEVSSPL